MSLSKSSIFLLELCDLIIFLHLNIPFEVANNDQPTQCTSNNQNEANILVTETWVGKSCSVCVHVLHVQCHVHIG